MERPVVVTRWKTCSIKACIGHNSYTCFFSPEPTKNFFTIAGNYLCSIFVAVGKWFYKEGLTFLGEDVFPLLGEWIGFKAISRHCICLIVQIMVEMVNWDRNLGSIRAACYLEKVGSKRQFASSGFFYADTNSGHCLEWTLLIII